MISFGSACQMKGFGVWLCSLMERLMAAWRSTREWKTPCLSLRRVSLAKKPSTAFNHEHEMGVKRILREGAPQHKPDWMLLKSRPLWMGGACAGAEYGRRLRRPLRRRGLASTTVCLDYLQPLRALRWRQRRDKFAWPCGIPDGRFRNLPDFRPAVSTHPIPEKCAPVPGVSVSQAVFQVPT